MKRIAAVLPGFFAACLLLAGAVGTAQADNATTEAEAFKRLAAKALAINDSGPVGLKTAKALGLGSEGENLLIYQIEVDLGADLHLYNLAKDGSGRVVLVSRIDGVRYFFLLDTQQRPFAAAVKRSGEFFAVTVDSVRPQLMRIMAFWIDWAAKNTTK